jgi:acetyl-CoA carboxylase biotin carboxyl carrier protein
MSEEPIMPDDATPAEDAAEPADTEAPDTGRHLGNVVPVGPGTPSTSGGRSRPRDGDLMSSPGEAPGSPAPSESGDAALLGLVDRLAAILERGELAEVEVSSGDTTVIVRSAASVERSVAAAAFVPPVDGGAPSASAPAASASSTAAPAAAPARPSIKAPLTGIFYGAPSPGATPYVSVGDHVAVGQIIGLIEAMKLFNEIKSDISGRVAKVCADNGQLVKAKSPLIEVEPA